MVVLSEESLETVGDILKQQQHEAAKMKSRLQQKITKTSF